MFGTFRTSFTKSEMAILKNVRWFSKELSMTKEVEQLVSEKLVKRKSDGKYKLTSNGKLAFAMGRTKWFSS